MKIDPSKYPFTAHDFEDYLESKEHMVEVADLGINIRIIEVFNDLPIEFQWGVYQNYFYSKGVPVTIVPSPHQYGNSPLIFDVQLHGSSQFKYGRQIPEIFASAVELAASQLEIGLSQKP